MSNANTASSNNNRASARLPPALSPESPAIVQPFRDFIARGWISKLTFQVTPGSSSISVDLGSSVKIPEGIKREGLTPQQAKFYIEEAELWKPKSKEKSNTSKKEVRKLPNGSLTKEDFEGKDSTLLNRIREVANNVGENTARGRIGSLKMYKEGCDTFEKWWKQASDDNVGRLLVSKKYFDKLNPGDLTRLRKVCQESPFRGSELPTPPKKGEEDDSEEEEEPPVPAAKPAPAAPKSPPKPAAQKAKGNGGK